MRGDAVQRQFVGRRVAEHGHPRGQAVLPHRAQEAGAAAPFLHPRQSQRTHQIGLGHVLAASGGAFVTGQVPGQRFRFGDILQAPAAVVSQHMAHRQARGRGFATFAGLQERQHALDEGGQLDRTHAVPLPLRWQQPGQLTVGGQRIKPGLLLDQLLHRPFSTTLSGSAICGRRWRGGARSTVASPVPVSSSSASCGGRVTPSPAPPSANSLAGSGSRSAWSLCMGVPEGCVDGMSTEVLAGNGERVAILRCRFRECDRNHSRST